jgi:UDP-N-acetylglucosamine 1-carboxyvinyltransferase
MSNRYLQIKRCKKISGTVPLSGAKNAVLAIMSSLILTKGISKLHNVPHSSDVHQMIALLKNLGAKVTFDPNEKILIADTTNITNFQVSPDIMNKMRASILVMGPLLARFKKAQVALPGGCLIGARPINFHLKGFKEVGIEFKQNGTFLDAAVKGSAKETRIVFEYPSVGATENILMFAVLQNNITTTIVNAALEPEVLDLIDVLQKMGSDISCGPSLIITIKGVEKLFTVNHKIIPDRLEAGSLILAAAITKGEIHLPDALPKHMDVFLEKLKEMGHTIETSDGIYFKATAQPKAVSFKTAPYPGFPTDLQAQMMAVQCVANGTSVIEETVFENRLIHVTELQKLGAQITVEGQKATIRGVDELYGCEVIASDIRASCALVLAGLVTHGQTKMTGIKHWRRGYDKLEEKLNHLGTDVTEVTT